MKHYSYYTYALLIVLNIFFNTINSNDVLLLINYNHPHYESIPLLKKIYEPYFKKVVFYGPTQHPHVIDMPHYKGYFSYLCIADAMERFPDYEGYLFLMDDCILNPSMIQDFDVTKLSIAHCIEYQKAFLINIKNGPPFYWSWWQTQWGKKAVEATLKKLPKQYKKMLQNNCGKKTVSGAFSDFVYIPSSYKNQFIELANLFGQHAVFLEIALPTILCSLSVKSEWIWWPGRSIYKNPLKLFDKNAIFNHPLKLSIKEHRDFIEEFFKSLSQ